MNKPRVFVQIYTFYPTFGRKVMSFCPNLYFLPHIWTKTYDDIDCIQKEEKHDSD